MKKLMIFVCLMVFLIPSLSADRLFNGLHFEFSTGAESFSAPVKINDFDIFRYETFITIGEGELSYQYIYTLSLRDNNAIEKQNRVFAMAKMQGPLCEVYGKIGVLQFSEELLGGLKFRWQDEFHGDIEGSQYLEFMGKAMTSRPYNVPFWAIGTKIYFIKTEKITLNVNGEFSKFRTKKFYLDVMYNKESVQFDDMNLYLDKIVVDFDNIKNQMLKLGIQVDINGKNFSPWLNIGYVFYETILEGKYTSEYINYDFESIDIQNFSTKSKLINTLLLSSGVRMKIAKNFEIEASAFMGALNGAGLSWIILL